MNKFKKMVSGFTLVELLIVIGLLGAIALIVISAINPIEQSNRARDTKYKADSGQLVSAVDRYFVSHDKFPWQTVDPTTYDSPEDAVEFASAVTDRYGLCLAGDCSTQGVLIEEELKSEFLNRGFLQDGATTVDLIKLGKAQGSSESVYACFVPLSKSVRDKACAAGKVYTLATSIRTAITAGSDDCASTAAGWASGANVICLPE